MVKSRQFPPPKTSCTLCLDCCEHSPSQTLHRKAQPRSCAPCSITQPSALYHRRLTAASGGRRRPLSYQCRVELLLNQVQSFNENFRLHILIFPTCDFNRSSVAQAQSDVVPGSLRAVPFSLVCVCICFMGRKQSKNAPKSSSKHK